MSDYEMLSVVLKVLAIIVTLLIALFNNTKKVTRRDSKGRVTFL